MSKPLTGFMIIEDHTDDMSDWSGQITFPNPKGTNLSWLDPIEMIEKTPVDSLLDEVEKFIRASHHTDGCAHRYRNECDCNKFELLNSIKEFRSNE